MRFQIGRPRIPMALRLRDRYLAHWLKFNLPGESFGSIERALSSRNFPRRDGGSNGFNQPQCVARAARGEGMLSQVIVTNACEVLPWFGPVFSSPFWKVLARPVGTGNAGPSFSAPWVSKTGLNASRLVTAWDHEFRLVWHPEALIRRAGRLGDLDALGLLVACGYTEHMFLRKSFVGTYAVDVFGRLMQEARRAGCESEGPQHPFLLLASEIDQCIHRQLPRWRLLEDALLNPPMIRPRPPATYDEQARRDAAAKRAALRRRAKERKTS